MQLIARWSESSSFFWILWIIELAVWLWWFTSDLKNTHLPMNPTVIAGGIWLFVALGAFLFNYRILAFIMVGILALPLLLMIFFLSVVFIVNWIFGPIRWN